MKQTVILLVAVFFLASCNKVQSKLDKAATEIEYAEQNKKEMTSKDWANLETMMAELESDFELNRDKYNNEQVKEIGKIQGKYTALIVKKGLNDFQESIKDFENQVEGFIEGITDTINNQNK